MAKGRVIHHLFHQLFPNTHASVGRIHNHITDIVGADIICHHPSHADLLMVFGEIGTKALRIRHSKLHLRQGAVLGPVCLPEQFQHTRYLNAAFLLGNIIHDLYPQNRFF